MNGTTSRRSKWLYLPIVPALLSVGIGAAWSSSGSESAGPAAPRAVLTDTIELDYDQAYYDLGGASVPGLIPGSPVAMEGEVPEGGPRAKPGLLSVLVYMEPTLRADAAQRADVRAFAAQKGGHVKYEYETVLPDVLNLRDIPVAELEALEKLPGVVRVEIDEYHPNVLALHDSTPLIRALQSQITGAGYSADGAGVRVCVCDTGIDSDHLMYADRIDASAGYDFYNNDSNPEDDHGHGSHVSGIAVGGTGLSVDFGCGAGSQAFQGVAPKATLIGAKILNQFGGGYDSDIIAGINHCADQSPSGGRADVINLSIGTGQYSGPCSHSWAVAANNAVANGVVVVAASGNENYSNALSSPACGADVIAVGMTWKADYPTCEDPTTNWNWGICTDYSPETDDIGCFSNESDYLDVAAPGANIWSASNAAGGSSITGASGTSMSSPQVAGLAALILDADPSLTPAEVRQVIRDGAIDMGPAGFDRAYGYGRIDVLDSLALVSGPECSVPADCDDGLWCNGAEDCVSGGCVSGTPPDCNDGVGCTDDSCNEGTDSCDNIANDANCDNGLYCDGAETCDAVLDCQAGTPVNCNDGVDCTTDSCNDGTDSCDNVPDDGYCDNDLFCDGAETCDPVLGCQAGSDPCVGFFGCDEVNDVCVECFVDRDCADGLFCNGAETCGALGTCQAGTPVDCSDGVSCTDDSCNETTDSCDNVPNDAYCSDANPCTDDYCDAVLDCQYVPDDTNSCDDGEFCNGAETCSGGVCQPGTDPCPGQGCDEVNDVCVPLDCDYDGTCEAGEDCNTCPNDCISGTGGAACGNGVCEAGDGEDCQNCPADCNGLQTGKPSGRFCCGATEGCGDSRCNEDGWSCTTEPQGISYCCGDGTCEGAEDGSNCEVDCGGQPYCGDGTCDPDEDQCNCPEDCGTPPISEVPGVSCDDGIDNDCDGGVDCDDMSGDCDGDPACTCLARGEACTLDEQCCSNRCHRGFCK